MRSFLAVCGVFAFVVAAVFLQIFWFKVSMLIANYFTFADLGMNILEAALCGVVLFIPVLVTAVRERK